MKFSLYVTIIVGIAHNSGAMQQTEAQARSQLNVPIDADYDDLREALLRKCTGNTVFHGVVSSAYACT